MAGVDRVRATDPAAAGHTPVPKDGQPGALHEPLGRTTPHRGPHPTGADPFDADPFDAEPDELAGRHLTTSAIAEMLPGVLSPLLWGVNRFLVDEAFAHLIGALGSGSRARWALSDHGRPAGEGPVDTTRPDRPYRMVRRIRGRAALDLGALSAAATAMSGDIAAELEQQYRRTTSSTATSSTAMSTPTAVVEAPRRRPARRLAHDLRAIRLRERAITEVEVCTGIARRLAVGSQRPTAGRDPAAPAGHGGPALAAHLFRLVDVATRAMAAEVAVAADAAAQYRRLELLLARRLPAETATTLTGQVTAHVVAPIVDRRASAALFGGPTWEELGLEPVGSVGADAAGGAGHPAAWPAGDRRGRDDAAVILRNALGRAGTGARGRLLLRTASRLSVETTHQLTRREAAKAAVLGLGGEFRRTAVHAGNHLAATGRLADPGDVELLDLAELLRALRGGAAPSVDAIEARRRDLERAQHGPVLPERFTGWPDERADDAPAAPHDRRSSSGPADGTPPAMLTGRAVSGGCVEGRARVAADPLTELADGEIVVAVTTDPSWTPLLLQSAGIVLEVGGPLSHAAVLAREVGLPAVVGVDGATQALDGRWIRLDGDTGEIVILEQEPRR